VHFGIEAEDKHVAVLGRSQTVDKPAAMRMHHTLRAFNATQ